MNVMRLPRLVSPSDPVQSVFKKDGPKKKPRKRWSPKFQFVNVQYPKTLTKEGKKKFSVSFTYTSQGKKCMKTVYFGDASDYIFNFDQGLRLRRFDRLAKQDDPFSPNFWRLHLCNTEKTLKQAYVGFLKKMLDI